MKIFLSSVLTILTAAVIALAVDNYRVHGRLVQLDEQIRAEHDNSPVLKEIAGLRTDISDFERDVNSFMKLSADQDKDMLRAIGMLEDWVETSSVQGKWNGYKRQLGDYEARMEATYRQAKDSFQKKIDAVRIKYRKIKDVLAE